jgi:hypothetical protein
MSGLGHIGVICRAETHAYPSTLSSDEANSLQIELHNTIDRVKRISFYQSAEGAGKLAEHASRSPQYLAFPGVRGNGIASRTLASPVT